MAVRFTRFVPALLLLFCLASPSAAQETASETLVAGRRAITFRPFEGGTSATVGLWRVRDANSRFGWLFSGSVATNREQIADSLESSSTTFALRVGPELRRYSARSGRIAPFTFLGGDVGGAVARQDPYFGDASTAWSVSAGARAGLGVEFFPVRNVGLDAQVGLDADVSYQPFETIAGDGDRWSASIGTFAASLGGSFYF